MKTYIIIAKVEAEDEEEAIEEVGYRMHVHRTEASIASRLKSFSVQESEEVEY